MKAALTAEEWALWTREGSYELDGMLFAKDGAMVLPSTHGLAAAFLYGQPFGFTWEDVERLRAFERQHRHWATVLGEQADYVEAANEIGSLADRIAALLPPRNTP